MGGGELSWIHDRLLLKVENPAARKWHMIEAAGQHWSARQLDRQIAVLHCERLLTLALLRTRDPVANHALFDAW